MPARIERRKGAKAGTCTQNKSPGAPFCWCAGAVLLDWSHSLIPCIRCMQIIVSRTCDGFDPLRCESDFSDPIDRIFQGLPLELGVSLTRGLKRYPGICVSSRIRFAFLLLRLAGHSSLFRFPFYGFCAGHPKGKNLLQHPDGLRSNFVRFDLLRSVRKNFCVGTYLLEALVTKERFEQIADH